MSINQSITLLIIIDAYESDINCQILTPQINSSHIRVWNSTWQRKIVGFCFTVCCSANRLLDSLYTWVTHINKRENPHRWSSVTNLGRCIQFVVVLFSVCTKWIHVRLCRNETAVDHLISVHGEKVERCFRTTKSDEGKRVILNNEPIFVLLWVCGFFVPFSSWQTNSIRRKSFRLN